MRRVTYFRRAAAGLAIGAGCVGSGMLGALVVNGDIDSAVHAAVAADSSVSPVAPEKAREGIASANDLSLAFRFAAGKALPSVVAIETSVSSPEMTMGERGQGQTMPFDQFERRFGGNPFEGTPFEKFFEENGGPGNGGQGMRRFEIRPQSGEGLGSGVIIDKSGVILTNNHVVRDAEKVTVRLADGREFVADEVFTDPKTDLAVVKISGAEGLVAAELGDSGALEVGDWVLALGQPFGLEQTVTAGIVSAKHRGIGINDRENFIQTDAAINPGNSGGPLVTLDGRVIGINTAIHSRSGGNEGIGFAIPVDMAKWVSKQLVEEGKVRRSYLGVGIQELTPELATKLGVKEGDGVLVSEVFEGAPAAKAGLHRGDVILSFDGENVNDAASLQLAVEKTEPGAKSVVTIVRDGKRQDVSVATAEQPADYGVASRPTRGGSGPENEVQAKDWGLTLSDIDAATAESLGLPKAAAVVVSKVDPEGKAADAGLQPGMAIVQIDRHDVANADAAVAALKQADPNEGALLLVKTAQGSRYVVVK
jgi:serine protease Do